LDQIVSARYSKALGIHSGAFPVAQWTPSHIEVEQQAREPGAFEKAAALHRKIHWTARWRERWILGACLEKSLRVMISRLQLPYWPVTPLGGSFAVVRL